MVEKDSDRPIYSDLELSPNNFNTIVILILVNIEAFEFNRKLITEINISTLNIVDLRGL